VPIAVYLSLRSGAIKPGSSLTFTLTCTTVYVDIGRRLSTEAQSQSGLLVQMNVPPSGTATLFSMSPINGTAFSTVFTWFADNFQDEDLPLTYQFGYSLVYVSGSVAFDTDIPEYTSLRSVRN
jgi:hypothetical protein